MCICSPSVIDIIRDTDNENLLSSWNK
ncbi:hypothetical protein PUN28_016421 [Cardiocondyla obscurior]|uniref:Uncharacterized protein n=1 Tax=Cardiocondyla obscurior TaxID=286306 RepID=A0AAW2EP41_9HYME